MTMKFPLPVLCVPLMITACSGGEGSPVEGQYQQTVKVTKLDFPGLTDDLKAQTIEQMEEVAGNGPTALFCMTGKDGGAQWKEAASQMSQVLGGTCETNKDEGSATTLDLEMTCKGTAKGDMQVMMTGQANPNGYESSMSFDINDPATGETAKLAMEIGAKRVGNCPG